MSSSSSKHQKSNVRRLFDVFRASSPQLLESYPAPLLELPEETLRDPEMYGAFARWLVNDYTMNDDGDFLQRSTALGYLGSCLNQARDQVRGSLDTKTTLFFTCLDDRCSTPSARWLKGLKSELTTILFERNRIAGNKIDFSQVPIYKMHVEKMCDAYAREGSAESSRRSFSLVCHRQSSGRSAELANVSQDNMEYDPHYKCVIAEWLQPKTSKPKTVAFLAGYCCDLCFFKTWADRQVKILQGNNYCG